MRQFSQINKAETRRLKRLLRFFVTSVILNIKESISATLRNHIINHVQFIQASLATYKQRLQSLNICKASRVAPAACFSKVPKVFGPISGATIPLISSQRRGSKPSNFAILLVFLTFKTCSKISFSKLADCSSTIGFSDPKSPRAFQETGP